MTANISRKEACVLENPPSDKPRDKQIKQDEKNLEQIEYLLYQSTQGIHFMFDNKELIKVLSQKNLEKKLKDQANVQMVQDLLTRFIERPSIQEKKLFLETLEAETYELLVRAYFQLVENTILASTDVRH